MKKYPVKIMNLSDLLKFNTYVRKNHIKGEIVQNNYKTNARNILGLLIVLPLDSAELIVEKCDEAVIMQFEPSSVRE